jgi:beta-lactamase regulating signal transducer with metallopeptidase domain
MELSGIMQSAVQIAAGAAIASAWQGLLLAAFLWICMKLTPRLSAGTRFAVWSAAFVAILLLPVYSFAHGAGSNAATQMAKGANRPALHMDSLWALVIAAFWLALSLARAFSLAVSAARVRALWKSSIAVDVDSSLQSLLEKAGAPRFAQIYRSAKIYCSAEIDQPCVIGFFKPRILVPEWLLEKATSAEMRQIVMHEASHLRRWDDWTNLAQKLALVVFPLNPALWWIERQLCSEREEACDERVVRETRSPREYAVCLTNLAAERMQRRMRQHTAALSLGAWEHRSALARRIHSILRSGRRLSPGKARAIMAALVVVTTAGAVKLGGTSQLVEFTTSAPPASDFAEQLQPAAPPAAGYRDVAFREPVAVQQLAAPETTASKRATVLHRAAKPLGATARKSSLNSGIHAGAPVVRRVSFSADGAHSWIVVTRWQAVGESSPDRQAPVMFIQSVFRFSNASADATAGDGVSAVQTQTGWFVFQM